MQTTAVAFRVDPFSPRAMVSARCGLGEEERKGAASATVRITGSQDLSAPWYLR